MKANIGQNITRFDICKLACKAYLKTMTPTNIQAGFRKTGIYPLSPEAVAMEKLFPAEGFREENPVDKIKAIKSGKEAVEEFIRMKLEPKKENSSCSCACKDKKKNMKRPKPGGKAITEDEFVQEIQDYENGKNNDMDIDYSPNKENIHPLETKKRPTKKSLKFNSPKPSTSGTRTSREPAIDPDSDSEYEEVTAEEDLCCVCKKWSPPNLNNHPGIKLVTWAYCDSCSHCVHLLFCTAVRVVRRHSTFLCPCCEE